MYVCVFMKVYDYRYGECGEKKYLLQSLMEKRIKRKTTNQKGREKEHKTKSFYICSISLT